jgi:hypothetical protein
MENDSNFLQFLIYPLEWSIISPLQLTSDHQTKEKINMTSHLQDYIQSSDHHYIIKKLYEWYKLIQPLIIQNFPTIDPIQLNDFISTINHLYLIENFLTQEEASYFCSKWLDGFFVTFEKDNYNSIRGKMRDRIKLGDFFAVVFYNGHLQTGIWLLNKFRHYMVLEPEISKNMFIKICQNNYIECMKVLLSTDKKEWKRLQIHYKLLKLSLQNQNGEMYQLILDYSNHDAHFLTLILSKFVDLFIDICWKKHSTAFYYLYSFLKEKKIDMNFTQNLIKFFSYGHTPFELQFLLECLQHINKKLH